MSDSGISVDNRTSSEIDLEIDVLEKEVKRLLIHKGVIEDEYNILTKDIIELDLQKLEIKKKKQDLKIRLDKARHIVGDMEASIKLERRLFWLAKHSGN